MAFCPNNTLDDPEADASDAHPPAPALLVRYAARDGGAGLGAERELQGRHPGCVHDEPLVLHAGAGEGHARVAALREEHAITVHEHPGAAVVAEAADLGLGGVQLRAA
jgi:hypothetical protein